MSEKLLYPKELAAGLKKSRTYVCAMKKAGFLMPGGTASLKEARQWLKKNHNFSSTAYVQGKKPAHRPKKITPSCDTEKEVLFYDGAEIYSEPELGMFDQAVIDTDSLPENLKEQGLSGDLLAEVLKGDFAFDSKVLGEIVFQKLMFRDVKFFKALAHLVERRVEESREPVDPWRMELLRLKREATARDEKHSVGTIRILLEKAVQDGRLEYVKDDKTIRADAKAIGYPLAAR